MFLSRKFFPLFLLLFTLLFPPFAEASWDVELWQYVNWTNWKSCKCRLYTVGEMRMDHDLYKFYYFRISENFAYQALKFLDLEMHYSFLYYKPKNAKHFINANRLEFEFNPSFKINDQLGLVWRNRLDLIKKQRIPGIQSVFRQRLKCSYTLERRENIIALFCSDEVFFDLNIPKFTQNRFIPLGLTFNLATGFDLDLFCMLRHFYSHGSEKWYKSVVIGSEIRF